MMTDQVTQATRANSTARISHQRHVQISVLGQAFPLLHVRARFDTSTSVTCLLLDASSDSSSYTSIRSASRRTRLHDPRTPATTPRTPAQTCNGLSTSAPVVQLSRPRRLTCVSFGHSLLWCITLCRTTL